MDEKGIESTSEPEAKQLLGGLRSRQIAYYNPVTPEHAVLLRGVSYNCRSHYLVLVITGILLMAVSLFLWRNRGKTRDKGGFVMSKNTTYLIYGFLVILLILFSGFNFALIAPGVMGISMLLSAGFGAMYKGKGKSEMARKYALMSLSWFVFSFAGFFFQYSDLILNDAFLILLSLVFCCPVIYGAAYFMFYMGSRRNSEN
jgi:hypothetical protein